MRGQEPTGFLNRTVTVDGVSHRYQVYIPADYSRARRWPVILFLHGSGERGTDGLLQTEVGLGEGIRRHAGRWPAIVVFPQAPPYRRWHGKVAHLALATLDRTLQEFSTDADRVYLVGLSAGANGVWNLAYRSPERFAALIAVCGWVMPTAERREAIVPPERGSPYSVVAGRIRALPVWIWHGEADGVVPVEESRRMAPRSERRERRPSTPSCRGWATNRGIRRSSHPSFRTGFSPRGGGEGADVTTSAPSPVRRSIEPGDADHSQ